MNTREFRNYGKQLIDYACDYIENLHTFNVKEDNNVYPGWLKYQLPESAPYYGENFEQIILDINSKLLKGMVHWQHPNFFGYFASENSYPSILGELLSNLYNCLGFSWDASPVCSELEALVLNWLVKALGLPRFYLNNNLQMDISDLGGGGVLQGSASECIFTVVLTARNEAIKNNISSGLSTDPSKFVAYFSSETHSCVEKNCKLALVSYRKLQTDSENRLRGEILDKTIAADIINGYYPFLIVATLGTTTSCSFDNLEEISQVRRKYNFIWLHVDAAYAGNAFLLPKYRYLLNGIDYTDSFNFNPNKGILTNFDCSVLLVRNKWKLISTFYVEAPYLKQRHDNSLDYRHWGIPLSRRFRSLKLWMVIRNYGIYGLQTHLKKKFSLAKYFESLIKSDKNFEVNNKVVIVKVVNGKDNKKMKKIKKKK